jgi:ABC-type glutathione transport system ATPase component
MSTALRVRSLWKSYAAGVRGCSIRVWALRGVSLSIEVGERVAVVGPRGAGKTTLVQCILGLRRPDAGVVQAPGLSDGTLLLLTTHEWREQRLPLRVRTRSVLVLGEDAGMLRAVDRTLFLRAGRLTAAPAPSVAPRQWVTDARAYAP